MFRQPDNFLAIIRHPDKRTIPKRGPNKQIISIFQKSSNDFSVRPKFTLLFIFVSTYYLSAIRFCQLFLWKILDVRKSAQAPPVSTRHKEVPHRSVKPIAYTVVINRVFPQPVPVLRVGVEQKKFPREHSTSSIPRGKYLDNNLFEVIR